MSEEYTVIYLDGVECEVCRRLSFRHRIRSQPVAVFVKKSQINLVLEKLEEFNKVLKRKRPYQERKEERKKLNSMIREIYKDVKGEKGFKFKSGINNNETYNETYLTCIFHSPKSNSIWSSPVNLSLKEEFYRKLEIFVLEEFVKKSKKSIIFPYFSFPNPKHRKNWLLTIINAFSSFELENIEFIFPKFTENFYLGEFSFFRSLKAQINTNIKIEEPLFKKLDFSFLDFKKNFHLLNLDNFKEIRIRKCQFDGNLHIKGERKNRKYDNSEQSSAISLEEIFFLNEKSQILINNLKLNNLILKNIQSLAKEFKVTFIKVTNKFAILNSEFKSLYLANCDFSQAKEISIQNSDLSTLKLINVNWGEISEKRICSSLFEREPLKAKEVYRQLKHAYEEIKDYYHADQFFALEMKALEKYLQENIRNKPKLIADLIVLKIHKWVSNFGQSWVRPLVWLLFLSLVVSFLFQKNLYEDYYHKINEAFKISFVTNLSYGDFWGNIKALIGCFILLLTYIFHTLFLTIKTLAEVTQTVRGEFQTQDPLMISLYFLYTILSAYLIYQFIVAVKRKVRR